MIWKTAPVIDSLSFRKSRTYIVHNTINIPDSMVIASSSDIPEITIRFDFQDTEERTKVEVESVIRCMNERGKFVSKLWICDKLNFKERKGDMYFTALKREGRICELTAVRHGRRVGTYYRIASHDIKRKMQMKHAEMRRELRGSFRELLNSPKGSLGEAREENQTNFSDSPGSSENDFGPEERISLRHQRFMRNFEDGSPGDGREHTFYTSKGCFDRLTNPETNPREYQMIQKLVDVSNDGMLIPAAARSAARRIDSLVINDQSVDAVCKIIKEKKLAYNLIDIIRNFEQILTENTYVIRKDEIDVIGDQINLMTEGSTEKYLNATMHTIYKNFIKYNKLPDGHPLLSFDSICNEIRSVPFLPIYGILIILSMLNKFDSLFIKRIADEFKDRMYKELTDDIAACSFVKKFKNFDFVNWNEFETYRIYAVGSLRCMLFVNRLSNRKLDNFFNQLTFVDKLYGNGSKQLSGSADIYNSSRGEDISRSSEQNPWSVGY